MPTILHQLDQKFRAAIKAAFGVEADAQLAASQNEKFGDYQSNAAMGLVKILAEEENKKLNPRAIAEQIKAKLELGEMATEVSIAGPGFINVKLAPRWSATQLSTPLFDLVGTPQTIVVDYSGPNIAKEMHVGHLRSTIIGDAISRILEGQGHKIIRQNHIGDWGTQFGMLIAELKREKQDWSGTTLPTDLYLKDLEGFYQKAKKRFDEESDFAAEAHRNVTELQSGDPQTRQFWQFIVAQTRIQYQAIYRRLEVRLTEADERGESQYNDQLASVVSELKKDHVAEISEGAVVVKVPGYESPLIIQKSDGGYLYGTTDLAAIRYRIFELHAQKIIYTHDSRQQQHFNQVFWTAELAGWAKPGMLIYAPFGTMLGEDGKPFKTRSGGTVKLKDLLDEAEQRALAVVSGKNPELPEEKRSEIAHSVGIGGVKYSDLAKDRISDYVFSFDKMLALDGNTAPISNMPMRRIRSIGRKAPPEAVATPENVILESPFELALAKHILRFGEVVELAARELKPHYLCTYLYELATRFSGFYENCPVLQSEPVVRGSRLALCEYTAKCIETGLDLLGIEHPNQM